MQHVPKTFGTLWAIINHGGSFDSGAETSADRGMAIVTAIEIQLQLLLSSVIPGKPHSNSVRVCCRCAQDHPVSQQNSFDSFTSCPQSTSSPDLAAGLNTSNVHVEGVAWVAIGDTIEIWVPWAILAILYSEPQPTDGIRVCSSCELLGGVFCKSST